MIFSSRKTTTPYQWYRCSAMMVALLLQSACGMLPPKGEPVSGESFKINTEIQQWQLQGKIGIRYDNNAASPYLNWLQCDEHFDIRLSGPLGQGAAHLYGDSRQATLVTSDQQTRHASTAGQLLSQQLGWDIPLAQLHFWIRGLPDPTLPQQALPQPNANRGFQQSGWLIRYPRQLNSGHYQLPAKLIAEHPQLKLTLILKHWNLQPDCSERLANHPSGAL